MRAKMIAGTDSPERLVCTAARNDYRSDGVIGHPYAEIMAGVDTDDHVEQEVRDLWFDEEYVGKDDPLQSLPEPMQAQVQTRSLLKHTMSQGHWGVFEHPHATVAIEGVTRVAMAQITRHRHFTFDIMSLRYVDVSNESVEDRFQIPEAVENGEVMTRDGFKELDDPERIERIYIEAYEDAIERYRSLIDEGMPPEEARKVLPMGIEVNIVMSGNARAWMHLLNIRGKANVQAEAKNIADALMSEMKDWMPYTFDRFDEMLPMRLNP